MHPLETYLRDLYEIHCSGAAVQETSSYPALAGLLDEIGKTLKPGVRCILHPHNRGAGIPDGGLFTAEQLRGPEGAAPALPGPLPARGALEVKPVAEELDAVAESAQVARYLSQYGLVLLTNYRAFRLVRAGPGGRAQKLEGYSLAPSAQAFWAMAAHPAQAAHAHGERLADYLRRAMLAQAPLTTPAEVAWFLASYAREARAHVEGAKLPALQEVRRALEQALGLTFEGAKGEHFFRSTLVQTLFYGVFSAWVLWHGDDPSRLDAFDWRTAAFHLRVPIIQALYEQVADPSKLRALGLMELLDWAGAALNRVERGAFFAAFEQGQAVQYFYEPFLRAFDAELRKELGVWYTPPEIVRYMVARVDAVLRQELDIPDGLADPRVIVLDPCAGTGAYLVEALRRIERTLRENGEGALAGGEVKRAARERVFGFELLPAPYVVAHLQLGLLLQSLGAPLDAGERAGLYLTNALSGWEPPQAPPPRLPLFAELAQERDAADHVKREAEILVVLGNPPYNAFAGVAIGEEQNSVEAYKEGLIAEWGIKKFNLDDLYVRFFRLAERRIAEQTGRGVVCFISNFSYLSDPSFVVMRQHFLHEFDALWIDRMNGDSRETGKLTPDGKPDPSVFSTDFNREGIRVGTAIMLMARKPQRAPQPRVGFRQFWGVTKRADLLASLNTPDFDAQYAPVAPTKANRYALVPSEVSSAYLAWPKLVELCAALPSNGLMEKRGGALIAIEREALEARMRMYYDPSVAWEALAALGTGLTEDAARFDAKSTRSKVISAEAYNPSNLRRYALRPFDTRYCYYSGIRPLWNELRPTLWAQCWEGNAFLMSRPAGVAHPEGVPLFYTRLLGDNDFLRGHAYYFPLRLRMLRDVAPTANLSPLARAYLAGLGIADPGGDAETAALVWLHALAIGYSPAYLRENADGLRQDWPRIPLPADAALLRASAELGQRVAALLDVERPALGVPAGPVRAELREIAVVEGPTPLNLAVTANWGLAGQGGVTMPGKGQRVERAPTPQEYVAALGETTHDVYLNDNTRWRNVPARVWEYTIGGYQVLKKWLSYREARLLGRALTLDEVREVRHMARRIAALVLLEPELDANYAAAKERV